MANGYESSCQLARDLDAGITKETVAQAFQELLKRRGAKVANNLLAVFKAKAPTDIKKPLRRKAVEAAYRLILNPGAKAA